MDLYLFTAGWSETATEVEKVVRQGLPKSVKLKVIDADDPERITLRQKLSVRTIPTLVWVGSEGEEVDRREGEITLEQFKNWLDIMFS